MPTKDEQKADRFVDHLKEKDKALVDAVTEAKIREFVLQKELEDAWIRFNR